MKKINQNVYQVELPEGWKIRNTFNVVDLYAYHENNGEEAKKEPMEPTNGLEGEKEERVLAKS